MTVAASSVTHGSHASNVRPAERLIVALDVSSAAEALKIVSQLEESVNVYKVGMQLYTAEGPEIVRELVRSGRKVFLDLKYHDIPNTVGSAVREAAQLGVSMLTVHASGGRRMLEAAVQAAQPEKASSGTAAHRERVKILAVTVLTSMDQEDLNQTGVPDVLLDQVVRLATMAREAGCAGVVSSAREAEILRGKMGDDFLIVTPGVRPSGSEKGDQARVVTPGEAISAGASHIVVGRPITAANDPVAAAQAILEELGRNL